MISSNFSSDIAKTLNDLGTHDILQMEQYMDFVRCRYLRKTLICRNSIRLNRAIDSGVVTGLLLASDATPSANEVPLDPAQRVTYQGMGGGLLTHVPVTADEAGDARPAPGVAHPRGFCLFAG